jgi:hypothetical protein
VVFKLWIYAFYNSTESIACEPSPPYLEHHPTSDTTTLSSVAILPKPGGQPFTTMVTSGDMTLLYRCGCPPGMV